jgi:DNA-binding PadR family transcriptional regulator
MFGRHFGDGRSSWRHGWRGDEDRGCSPRRHGRHEDFEDSAFGFGGRGWSGGRGSRMFGHGDLRLVLLALIQEKPRHGYDLIRAIEEKFNGAYAPSPGAVYPTLTMLEEQDHVRSEAAGGGKKLYTITPDGEAFLAENRATVDALMARMDVAASAFRGRSTPDAVRESYRTLKHALHMRSGQWTQAEVDRVRAIIEKAARDIASGQG